MAVYEICVSAYSGYAITVLASAAIAFFLKLVQKGVNGLATKIETLHESHQTLVREVSRHNSVADSRPSHPSPKSDSS